MSAWPSVGSHAADAPPSFSRDILPIMSDNCFQCHGPDAKSREAELRLDQEEGALRKVQPVIVPGKSSDSELLKRVLSTYPDAVMPPAKSGRKLTPQQIESLKHWIDDGANWGKHWAFEKPVRPNVPDLKSQISNLKSQIKNPIVTVPRAGYRKLRRAELHDFAIKTSTSCLASSTWPRTFGNWPPAAHQSGSASAADSRSSNSDQ